MSTSATAAPILLDTAFDDPHIVRRLVDRSGPYASIATYLPPSATDSQTNTSGPLPWFRATWAADGRCAIDGARPILANQRFAEAASRLFGGADVRPTTVVVNVNAPMSPGAIHVDIPSFHGANRDRFPLRLLQAMGTSGLFETWRIVEAGAVTWFYDGPGGAYDYWPDGLSGAMRSCRPPFDNVALVADNDRMYHRIGWVGAPDASGPALTAAATIAHDDRSTGARWTISDDGSDVASFPDPAVRISILWKAQIMSESTSSPLDRGEIAQIFERDLAARGIAARSTPDPLDDDAWIDLVHRTYYPKI